MCSPRILLFCCEFALQTGSTTNGDASSSFHNLLASRHYVWRPTTWIQVLEPVTTLFAQLLNKFQSASDQADLHTAAQLAMAAVGQALDKAEREDTLSETGDRSRVRNVKELLARIRG